MSNVDTYTLAQFRNDYGIGCRTSEVWLDSLPQSMPVIEVYQQIPNFGWLRYVLMDLWQKFKSIGGDDLCTDVPQHIQDVTTEFRALIYYIYHLPHLESMGLPVPPFESYSALRYFIYGGGPQPYKSEMWGIVPEKTQRLMCDTLRKRLGMAIVENMLEAYRTNGRTKNSEGAG